MTVRSKKNGLGSTLSRLAALMDAFVPVRLREESAEQVFRARVAVGIAMFAAGVFLSLALIRALSGRWSLVAVNLVQTAAMVGFPWILRRGGQLQTLISGALSAAFGSFLGIALLSAGSGFTMPAMGLAILPLCATFLSGTRRGALWAALSISATMTLGLLGATRVIPHRTVYEGLLGEHATLVLLTSLLFLVGALYEYGKTRSVRQIELLERMRHEAERERMSAEAKAQIAEAGRLAALGQIAAMAAHEINNPLSYVGNNLEHIERYVGARHPPEDVSEAIRDATEGVARIRRIVDDLQDYARPDDLEGAATDVASAVATALKTAEGHTRPRARVTTHFEDVPPVVASHYRLVQVLLNLVVNAAQAIPEGHAPDNVIAVSVFQRDDGRVCVEVRDTGSGIPEEILSHVKEPFFTTKRRGEGSGLGLALSDHVLRAYGGQLELENTAPGALARAVLVAAPPGSSVSIRAATRVPSSFPAPSRSLDVLVIDDDVLVARAITRRLKDHAVATARGGREALKLLEHGSKFDAILCDVMMPDLTGMDVYDQIAKLYPELAPRMIFMTGGTFTERARRFRSEVPNAFLDKPLDTMKVREALTLVSGAPLLATSRGL